MKYIKSLVLILGVTFFLTGGQRLHFDIKKVIHNSIKGYFEIVQTDTTVIIPIYNVRYLTLDDGTIITQR